MLPISNNRDLSSLQSVRWSQGEGVCEGFDLVRGGEQCMVLKLRGEQGRRPIWGGVGSESFRGFPLK